jgi:hypothetical protein
MMGGGGADVSSQTVTIIKATNISAKAKEEASQGTKRTFIDHPRNKTVAPESRNTAIQ